MCCRREVPSGLSISNIPPPPEHLPASAILGRRSKRTKDVSPHLWQAVLQKHAGKQKLSVKGGPRHSCSSPVVPLRHHLAHLLYPNASVPLVFLFPSTVTLLDGSQAVPLSSVVLWEGGGSCAVSSQSCKKGGNQKCSQCFILWREPRQNLRYKSLPLQHLGIYA